MSAATSDVWEVMSTARTIRRFTDEPVDDATLMRCLEAATWAPSGANAQAWRFIVLRSPEQRAVVAKAAAHALAAALTGWIQRERDAIVAYQKEEIRALREMLGGKRLRFTDAQRRRLALKARPLSHAKLRELGSLVTPDTLTRWFRQYAGAKYDSHAKRGPGRDGAR